MSIKRTARQRGLSLIELLMFIVIVSIAVVAIVRVMSVTAVGSADPLRRKQALLIAESMLEEIELAHFTYCDASDDNADTATATSECAGPPEAVGPEAGDSRPYDNVNDYVAAFGTPKAYATDVLGNNFPTGYTAQVTIQPDAALGTGATLIAPADATPAGMTVLRITVSVVYGGGADDTITLDGYRTRYAGHI
ncbi:MAG TPA: MSHA biogenesis protein MshD [Janthinobacterium sp.]|nr:MSHA biogenesis protein MshD [Janthinobacterium sp.]